MDQKIAILITCFNRRDETIACLKSLFLNELPQNYILQVFLVDDGSIDGTSEVVKENFPQVNVMQGTGDLFWNQGMRLAWESASKSDDYDFYFWLNDDTLLDEFALQELLNCYSEVLKNTQKYAIITGACRKSKDKNEFSYGGRNENGPVVPNGQLQMCKYINGNVVLISREVFKKLGNLSSEYTHAMGDFDYGLRALNNGIKCYTTKKYIATCPNNEGLPGWCDPNIPFKNRWNLLHSPKGLNIKEYNIFRKKFWGWKWIIYATKAYLKMISPTFYTKINNTI